MCTGILKLNIMRVILPAMVLSLSHRELLSAEVTHPTIFPIRGLVKNSEKSVRYRERGKGRLRSER